MIDAEGFRSNVGIVLSDGLGQVFWAKRTGRDIWQFPQGGIEADESVESAMFRELREEVGLVPGHVEIISRTDDWLRYRFPEDLTKPGYIGQKQIWYLLQLLESNGDKIDLSVSKRPEFDSWKWVDYNFSVKTVVSFKREVYGQVFKKFAPFLG